MKNAKGLAGLAAQKMFGKKKAKNKKKLAIAA